MKVKTYKKWDLHHHIVPDFYVNEMKKLGISVAGIKWPTWNAKASIKMMDSYATLDVKCGLTEQQIEDIFMGNAKRLFSYDRVLVQNASNTPYARPSFGGNAQRILYHCHSEEEALSALASGDYDKVFLSFDSPHVWQLEAKERQVVLRKYNDTAAKIRSKNPHRMGAFCIIDPASPDWSLSEIDRALNELNLDGVA